MRTTVNIDDDILAEVKIVAARQHRTIGSVLEEALAAFLASSATGPEVVDRHRLPVGSHSSGLRPGVDLFDAEQLATLLGENTPARPQ